MPTYDYKCKECGITFEYFQKMTDEHIKNCIECDGEVKRLIGSGMTPIFKGSGFYETDYKTKKKSSKEDSKSVTTSSEKKENKKVAHKKSA
jgi:putative FmdB family regulatory protein